MAVIPEPVKSLLTTQVISMPSKRLNLAVHSTRAVGGAKMGYKIIVQLCRIHNCLVFRYKNLDITSVTKYHSTLILLTATPYLVLISQLHKL